jgi:penicillin amidase
MARRNRNRRFNRRWGIGLGVPAILVVAAIGYVGWIFQGSAPMLDGRLSLAGLSAPVEITRDDAGVPTVTAANRIDLARSLGFLHAQERFFQMDLLRRSGAGELSELVGDVALDIDAKRRRHRFRARAEEILARLPATEKVLLDAYTAGANAGFAALGHAPFEYSILRVTPVPWRDADTLLVVYAMYFELEESDGWSQRRQALADQALGPTLAAFLYPKGTPADAALDGSMLPEPPLPEMTAPPAAGETAEPPEPVKGSNAFAVAGRLTATGSALVANDEHLGLSVPNIWYRARLRTNVAGAQALDLAGTTLPGIPFLVAGSNGHIAWGFTDSYIETGDAIVLDAVDGDPARYQTPDGPKPLRVVSESLCAAHSGCRDLAIEETVWGPVVARDGEGRRIAWRWIAQDATAVNFTGILALERATDVRTAIDAAHHVSLPDQNVLIGDKDGHIAWTIAGQVPRRVGLDDGVPHSWADGTHGWQGYLAPDEVPEIIDPPSGRLWTANNRMVGGEALARLGAADYAEGDRARQIRDDLLAKDQFAEADFLAIQLDDRALALEPWQRLLLALLQSHKAEPRYAAMLPYVKNWGGEAAIDSVGYRLVRGFQSTAVRLVYGAFTAPFEKAAEQEPLVGNQSNWPVLHLLTERPANLVPKPYEAWDDVTNAVLTKLAAAVDEAAGGNLAHFTWGARNHAGIHHPLARAVPFLGRLTDPPDEPLAGDDMMPRVIGPGSGASERFVVSPGREGDGIFEMPTSQAGNPFAPYYLVGHQDWVEGRPSPFLPSAPRWRLILEPS